MADRSPKSLIQVLIDWSGGRREALEQEYRGRWSPLGRTAVGSVGTDGYQTENYMTLPVATLSLTWPRRSDNLPLYVRGISGIDHPGPHNF